MSSPKFWEGPIYRTVQAMKATGNRPGVIAEWKAGVERWAAQSNSPDATAVKAWLPLWQPRPAYTAAELAPIFPALAVALGFSKIAGRMPPQQSPARLANGLRYARLPSRMVGDVEYFIVERCHYWQNAPQEEFENALG